MLGVSRPQRARLWASLSRLASSGLMRSTTSTNGVAVTLPPIMPTSTPCGPLLEVFDRGGAQSRGQHAVGHAGRAAALHMAELAHAHVEAEPRCVCLEVLRQRVGIVSRAFGHHHQRVCLAALVGGTDLHRHGLGLAAPLRGRRWPRRRRRYRPWWPDSRSRGPSPRPGSRGWCDEAVTRSRSTDSSATSMAVVAPMVMSDPDQVVVDGRGHADHRQATGATAHARRLASRCRR